MADGAAPLRRYGVRVRGGVQGVGFRPYVYRLAKGLNLTGFVLNDAEGVWIEAQGAGVEAFLARLPREAPTLARIEGLSTISLAPQAEDKFVIAASAPGASLSARVPPDAGICQACLEELFDPHNRRRGYAFIACCDCGPRFTMTRRLPYDRPQTAMEDFPLCAACAAEYGDPASRRFHAEPTCCAACGPSYEESAAAVFGRIAAGQIVALKGVGGYHLMADARQEQTVETLRQRKERGGKPFAVLAANLASVRAFAACDETEAALLSSPVRPIVLLRARPGALPDALAPGLDTIGVMLPATPMQWLLFHEAAGRPEGLSWTQAAQDALFLCTSANPGGEPLITDDAEARDKLRQIADAIIAHDRPIVTRADDAVARAIAGAPVYLRRGRGVTPEPIALPFDMPATLAFGGHMKAAVCVTRGREAFLAQHVGDLDDPVSVRFHAETAAHLVSVLGVKPERVACDLHPDFISTRRAEEAGPPVVRVQHHHAHALACAAENGVTGPFLALALDGYGYGPQGEAWGGELLAVEGLSFRRLGGLAPLPAPGGDKAAREPWRMAAAALQALGRGDEIPARFAGQALAASVQALLVRGGVGETTSCGRLFDAAAGLIGVCAVQSYEAEAAMRLEALAGLASKLPNAHALPPSGGLTLSPLPLLAGLLDLDPAEAALRFHLDLAAGLAGLAAQAAVETGISTVALTGGCLANAILAEALCDHLRACGLDVLMHRLSPPGDGGLALGQAYAAGLWEER